MADKLRLAMLVSGGGSTARAIIKATEDGRLQQVEPVCVLLSPGSSFPEQAREEGVNVGQYAVNPKQTTDQFAEQILTICRDNQVDIIGQYGWMPLTPAAVIEAYPNRMINQHPGPLDPQYPDFGGQGMYGRRVHAARLLFVRMSEHDFWTEATAQFVDPEFDQGAVIHTQRVQIGPDDDVISLQQKTLQVEYAVQIEALKILAEERVQDNTRGTRLIDDSELSTLQLAKEMAAMLFPRG